MNTLKLIQFSLYGSNLAIILLLYANKECNKFAVFFMFIINLVAACLMLIIRIMELK